MNTKGTKFLAVLAVFAMAFTAVAVLADEADAAVATPYTDLGDAAGPFDFTASDTVTDPNDLSNVELGNNLIVAYNADTKTYTVTGTLNQQDLDATDPFNALWPSNTDTKYGFVFKPAENGQPMKIGTFDGLTDGCHLQYLKSAGTFKVLYKGDEYVIDCSGVTLATSHSTEDGFVGLKGYNANVKINVSGAYDWGVHAPTNASLGNSVSITEVEKSSSDLYAEYTINAKLAYSDLYVKGMDVGEGSDYKYALIYQITGLKAYDNYIAGTLPYSMKWNPGQVDWMGKQASEASGAQETFAIYFKAAPTTASSSAMLYFGPVNMESSTATAYAAKIKINFNVEVIDQTQTKDVTDANKDAKATEIKNEMGQSATSVKSFLIDVTDTTFEFDENTKVGEKETLVVTTAGTGAITGDVSIGTGTDAQKVTFTGVKGTVEISKGSIKVFGNPWSAGTITLYKDDVAKVSGDVGGVNFAFSGTGSAQLIIEAGTTLTIADGQSFVVGANIEVIVDGTVAGVDVTDSVFDVKAAKSVTINNGAVMDKVKVDNTGKAVTVYSGSDINASVFTAYDKIAGKDAASGKWSYSVIDGLELQHILTLDNYNGTYNFYGFAPTLTKIDLIGDNVVSYAFEADFAEVGGGEPLELFGHESITSITTATAGSLAINVDVSKVPTGALFGTDGLIVISASDLEIDGVGVSITVTGSNNAWTADDKAGMKIAGIGAVSVDAYTAGLDMDIMSAYTAENVVAIAAATGVQFRSCDDIIILSGGYGIVSELVGGLTVKATDLFVTAGVLGISTLNLNLSNIADVFTLSGIEAIGDVVVSMESELTSNGFDLGGALTNDGTVTLSGAIVLGDTVADVITNNSVISVADNVVINGAIINNGTFTNNGTIGLFGTFQNKSAFNNDGTFKVFNDKIAYLANTFTVSEDKPTEATKARLGSIVIDSLVPNADGTASVKATLTLQYKDGDTFVAVGLNKFTGTLTPVQKNAGYTLALSDGTASVNVVYDATKGGDKVGVAYTISVSGSVKDFEGNLRYLEANKTGDGAATITEDTIKGLMTNSAAAFTATAGKTTSTGTFAIFSPATPAIDAEFEGDLVADVADTLTISGKFTGNITSSGAAAVAVSEKMVGNITAAGAVATTKDLTGDITADGNVTISGKFTGNVTMKGADKTFSVMGTAAGILTYTAEYKATVDATTKTASTATIDFATAGTTSAVEIVTVAGADATAEAAMKDVSFKLGAIPAGLGTDKTATIKATAGIFAVPDSKALVSGYELIIEAGATIEIAKAANLDVTNAALKVSKDAVKHYETGSEPAVTYGKVLSIMSFDIDGGAYTIYSNVAYALSNCDEGADITVLTSDTIAQSVTVKKGVNVIVGNGVTLTFDGKSVNMLEGAKITLEGNGIVRFTASLEDKTDDTAWVFFNVSGTVCFDDNVITFDGVRFTATATLTGIPETESAPSKISAVLPYNQGTAKLVSGNGIGDLTLGNAKYSLTKADSTADPVVTNMFSATFIVAEGATFEVNSFTDIKETIVAKKVDTMASVVEVSGTLKAVNNMTVNGTLNGSGEVVLPETKAFIVDDGKVSVKVTDVNGNGYAYDAVVSDATIAATAVKNGDNEYVVLSGNLKTGTINAIGTAKLNAVTIAKGATIVADTVDLITANSTANGILKTKVLNDSAAVTGNKDLVYDTTYADGDYTVYTMAANIDLTKITDITIDGGKFNAATFEGDIIDLSGKDVKITVKTGTVLNVTKPMIIGTAITALNGGSVIAGTFKIAADQYIIIYTDVDDSAAKYQDKDGGASVGKSTFDIDGTLYATVVAGTKVAGDSPELITPAASLVPAIKGYTFTFWSTYNGEDMDVACVGDTNVKGAAVAQKVVVKATFLEGVQYYCNGVLYDAVGIESKVTVGSIFTAKIVDYSRYQGTPLVNGQNAFEVTEDATLTVTGVSPVTPEPQPEPQPAGMTLTEILLIVLVILIAIMVVVLLIRLNRS